MSHWWSMHMHYEWWNWRAMGSVLRSKQWFETPLLRGYHQMVHLTGSLRRRTPSAKTRMRTQELQIPNPKDEISIWHGHIFRFNHRNLKDVMFSNSCRNQGQLACFPQKQPSWIGWCLGWVETYDYSGEMKILLPAVFMSYQGFDPLPGHVWSPLSKGWEAQVSGSIGAAGWKVQGPNLVLGLVWEHGPSIPSGKLT